MVYFTFTASFTYLKTRMSYACDDVMIGYSV